MFFRWVCVNPKIAGVNESFFRVFTLPADAEDATPLEQALPKHVLPPYCFSVHHHPSTQTHYVTWGDVPNGKSLAIISSPKARRWVY
jgi:hypothetical protein